VDQIILKRVPDAIFDEPRLADIYDLLEPDRPDLEPYLAMVDEFGARSVLDIGCGTGTFACLLAQRGIDVMGLDPARASLEVATRKPFAGEVTWVHGDIASLSPVTLDLATMTGNVAQVFLTDEEWSLTLRVLWELLRPGGRLIFEVRDPAKKAWREWNRERSYRRVPLPNVGLVETWVDHVAVELPLVSFRQTFVFGADDSVLTSDTTLCFRDKAEIAASLRRSGFAVEEVRDAPDRHGLEFVFVAGRQARRAGATLADAAGTSPLRATSSSRPSARTNTRVNCSTPSSKSQSKRP
jgi:SAM-dependent methyltransferase